MTGRRLTMKTARLCMAFAMTVLLVVGCRSTPKAHATRHRLPQGSDPATQYLGKAAWNHYR